MVLKSLIFTNQNSLPDSASSKSWKLSDGNPNNTKKVFENTSDISLTFQDL